MLLKINGEQVPYTLENEKCLGQFVAGVSGWLAGSGLVLTAVRRGGDDLMAVPREGWEALPLASIEELDFSVSPAADLRVEHWQTLQAWLGMLAEEVASPGPALDEILQGAQGTLTDARANPFEPQGTQLLDGMAALLAGQTAGQVRRWPAERRRQAAELAARMHEALKARIAQAALPQEALQGCVEGLRRAIPLLSEVPVQLATGRDRQAMQSIATVAELLQTLLALVPRLPPLADRQRLFTELNGVFRDVIAAFDARDTVLIGDLLEYEAAPRLGELLPLLEGSA